MTGQDPYRVLGVSRTATEDDVKKAYRTLAKQYHPDKNKDAGAEDKFKEIGSAYETLKDPEKKRVYDMKRAGEEERARMKKEQKANGPSTSTHWSFGSKASGNAKSGFKSSFSFFDDDEFFKKAKREFDGMSNGSKTSSSGQKKSQKGKKKKESGKPSGAQQRTFDFSRPDWSDDFNDDFKPPKNPFSFMHDPFDDLDDLFEDFFKDTFFTSAQGPFGSVNIGEFFVPKGQFHKAKSTPNFKTMDDSGLGEDSEEKDQFSSRTPRQNGQRKKTPNPEEDMWDWSKPMFNRRSKDLDSDYDYFDNDDDDDKYGRSQTFLFPCSYCSRKFSALTLSQHESVCRRWNQQKKPSPSPDKDTDRHESPRSTYKASTPRAKDWRKQPEDLNGARGTRRGTNRASREKDEGTEQTPPPPPKTPAPDLIECRWCHRKFNDEAAKRHIPFCTERSTNRGSPLNANGRAQKSPEKKRTVPGPSPTKPPPPSQPKAAPTSHKPPTGGTQSSSRPPSARPKQPPGGATTGGSTPRTPRAGNHGNMSERSRPKTRPPRVDIGVNRTTGRPYMDHPFTYTSSGLHAHVGSQRTPRHTPAYHSTRTDGDTTRNVHFDIPAK